MNLCWGRDGAAAGSFGVQLNNNAGTYRIALNYFNDVPAAVNLGYNNISDGYQKITIFWKASSGAGNDDGFAYIYTDDALTDSATGLDNDTHDVDYIQIGMLYTNSTTFSGS